MDIILRFALIAGIVIGALVVARLANRRVRPRHPELDLRGSGLEDRVVIFTSTDCTNCAAALAALKATGVAYREVTWELEPARLESLGVEAVPLIVLRDANGRTVRQIGGVPKRRSLARAMAQLV